MRNVGSDPRICRFRPCSSARTTPFTSSGAPSGKVGRRTFIGPRRMDQRRSVTEGPEHQDRSLLHSRWILSRLRWPGEVPSASGIWLPVKWRGSRGSSRWFRKTGSTLAFLEFIGRKGSGEGLGSRSRRYQSGSSAPSPISRFPLPLPEHAPPVLSSRAWPSVPMASSPWSRVALVKIGSCSSSRPRAPARDLSSPR